MINRLIGRVLSFSAVIASLLVIVIATQYFLFWTPPNPSCSPDQVEPTEFDELTMAFTNLVESFRVRENALGMQAALIGAHGKVVVAVGQSDRSKACPMTKDHKLYIGSVSKLVTSVLFYVFSEETKIYPHTQLGDVLHTDNLPTDIEFSELLHHTSGAIELTRSPLFLFKLFQPGYRFSTEEVAQASDWFDAEARGRFHYTNSNFMLIGRALEIGSGKTMDDLLQAYTQELTDVVVFWNEIPEELPIPRGYDRDVIPYPGILDMVPFRLPYTTGGFTAAGFLSDAKSMAIFVDNLFSSSRGRKDMGLLQHLNTTIPASEDDQSALVAYGAGMRVLEIEGQRWVGHTGTQTGYSGMAFHNLDADYTIALFANLSQIDQVSFMRTLTNWHKKFSMR